jgi:predicted amidohydrolase
MSVVAAAVQMTSGPEVPANLQKAASLVERAARRGAELIALPENFALMTPVERDKLAAAEVLDAAHPGPILSSMMEAAAKHRVHLVLGGMPERPDRTIGGGERVHNSCVLLGPDGGVRAVYRKIHLFDVFIPDGATYHESKVVEPGDRPLVAETPWGGLGLSVCYDLRFPELYRALAAGGARMLVVPAAFTLHTGRDHWHVLLRARAIENLCFVIAPAQVGRHDEKRVTFGHSLIVDPWGTVLADAADGEGVAVAELDFERQDKLRRDLPALSHRRI